MVGSLSEVYSYWKWPIYSWFSHQKLWFSIVMLVYQRCIYIHIYRLVLVSFYESFVKKTAVRLYQLHSSRDLTIILPYPAEAAHCIHFNTQVFLEFIVGRLHTVAGQVEDNTMESWWNWLDNRTVRYSFCNIKTDQNIISGRKLSRTWNILKQQHLGIVTLTNLKHPVRLLEFNSHHSHWIRRGASIPSTAAAWQILWGLEATRMGEPRTMASMSKHWESSQFLGGVE